MKFTKEEKQNFLNMSLEDKIIRSKQLIMEWYHQYDGNVYVAFSGGKDSTVLLHLVRSLYPEVPAVFCDTGLEYPEIREFVKKIDNVTYLKPKLTFKQIIDKYGYPIISKEQSQYIEQYRNAKSEKTKNTRWFGNKWGLGKISEKWKYLLNYDFKISDKCCAIMKKNPSKEYEKATCAKPIIGVMASESVHRMKYYFNGDCNQFSSSRPTSKPIFFWKEHDVWDYIKMNNIEYSDIYNKGYERTGCMFCMYGLHLEDKNNNRFDKMKVTHPKLYEYCINFLGLGDIIKIYLGK